MAHSEKTKALMSQKAKARWQKQKEELKALKFSQQKDSMDILSSKDEYQASLKNYERDLEGNHPEPITVPNKFAVVSRRETFKRDFNGATLGTVNAVLKSVYSGWLDTLYDWYDYLLYDPHILAVSQLRSSWVAGKTIKVLPADDSEEAAQAAIFIKNQLDRIPHLTLAIKKLLHAVFTGLEVGENVWEFDEKDGIYRISEIAIINPKKLYYTTNTMELKLSQRYGINALGDDFKLNDFPGKFIIHSPLTVSRYPQQAGLFYYISYRFLFRAIILQYGLAGLERYAFPWMYAKVPREMEESNRNDLVSMLDSFANDASAVFDKDVDLATIEATIATSGDNIITGMLNYFCDEISKVVLGGTTNLEATATGANRAIAEVHATNSVNIFMEDSKMLCETLEAYLVRYLIEYNVHVFGGKIPPMPKLFIDVKEYPRLDQIGVQYGKVSVNEVRKQYGLPSLLASEGGNDDAFRTKSSLQNLDNKTQPDLPIEETGNQTQTGDHKIDDLGIERPKTKLETHK